MISIEVDTRRLAQAANAIYGLGYTPTLATAHGLYGYWPKAKFDRMVAACSFRAVPPAGWQSCSASSDSEATASSSPTGR